MKQSRLTNEVKAILLDEQNQEKLAKVAKEFNILAGSLRINIKRDSSNLTKPCYTNCIKEVFKLPNKMVITEDFNDDNAHLSKHN